MDHHQKALRLGAVAVAAAILIRLWSGGLLGWNGIIRGLIWAQTGRTVTETTAPPPSAVPAPGEPSEPPTDPPEPLSFTEADAQRIRLKNKTPYTPDIPNLLTKPYRLPLISEEPTVLILHTHATESYADKDYLPSDDYRTLDENYNMLSLGRELTRLLEAGGVRVIHDTTLHDYPRYTDAYSRSRETVQRYLAQYPSIRLVLDLHRDAADTEDGQMQTSGTVDGQPSAQLMLVVGTDAGGLHHPLWEENLSLALKLMAVLERQDPGLCRYISLRNQRFNMDLSPGSLLIEIGAAGDLHGEALLAVHALARGLLKLATAP